MTADQVRAMVQRILEVAPMSVDGLAEEAGVSRHTLYAWAAGRRNPTPENLESLVAALDRRSGELAQLAEELRRAVSSP